MTAAAAPTLRRTEARQVAPAIEAALAADSRDISPGDLRELMRAVTETTERLHSTHVSLQNQVARLQQDLAEANAALRRSQALAALGEMAAGIAHEVRNPVNALLNAVPPLRRELEHLHGGEGESREMVDALLDSVERSGERIRHVVESMLALSRQAPGELRLRETHLSENIDATLSLLRFRRREGVEIRSSYEWDGPVWCYPELIGQVVMNLVINALDAVDAHGNIDIGLKREGFRVQVARDGAQALELFDVVRPDLVLLDVMLPKVSGIDVCREIRSKSKVPIIMVTAKGS